MRRFVILFFCLNASAATYFVDYVSGSDSANGTSTSTPFQHCPGDPRATGNANMTPAAGDTIVFHGGVTYAFNAGAYIVINASGTSGSPVTYQSGDRYSPQWGTTPAFIDGSTVPVGFGIGMIKAVSKNWLVIDGLTVANNTNAVFSEDYSGLIVLMGTCQSPVIKNCTLTNSGSDAIYIEGGFGSNPPGTNYLISDCTIGNTRNHGVLLRYAFDNVTFTNCTISYTGISNYVASDGGDGIFFAHGTTDQQNNIYVKNCDFSYSASKGSLIYEAPGTNMLVESCYFHGTNHVFSIAHAQAITNMTIRNCVFNQVIDQFEGVLRFKTDEGTASGPIVDTYKIYNNTIISDIQSGAAIWFDKGTSTATTLFYRFDIRNNVVRSVNTLPLISVGPNSAASGPVMDLATFSCDYNDYYGGSASPFIWNGTAMNFSTWKSTTSQDAHSITTAPSLDGNLMPTLGANVIDAGTTLSGFSVDKNSVTRPQGSAWDIGAYEFNRHANIMTGGTVLRNAVLQ